MATEILSERLTSPNLQLAVVNIEQAFRPEGSTATTFSKIFEQAEEVIDFLNREKTNYDEGRTGGVMAIIEVGDEPVIAIHEIGKVRPEKIEKYTRFALGKAETCLVYGYLASSQNEYAPETRKLHHVDGTPFPGGALKFRSHEGKEYILAFSGYSQEDDQVAVLLTAVSAGIISKEQVRGYTRKLRMGIGTLYNSYADEFFKPASKELKTL